MKLILTSLIFMSIGVLSQAQILIQRSSEEFSDYLAGRSYEAGVLPQDNTAAPFIRKRSGSTLTTENVSDGYLYFRTEAELSTLSYQVGDLSPVGGTSATWWTDNANPTKGFTVEIRMKAYTGAYDFNFIASYNNTNAENQVLIIEDTGTRWGTLSLSTAKNDTDFHTFRLVREANVNRYQLWRDGVLIGENLSGSVVAANRFWFGDWGGQLGGGIVDYIRWDTSGAYSPIPEPSSVALIVGGGILFSAIYRKR